MKFLIDVCAMSGVVVRALAEQGHDVLLSKDALSEKAEDAQILALAVRLNRVLITMDKDFVTLVFRDNLPHPCVIRFEDGVVPSLRKHVMQKLIKEESSCLEAEAFIVVFAPPKRRIRITLEGGTRTIYY